jgi:hypothetical protein
MQDTVDKYYSTPGVGQKIFFWTTYGDLDIRKKEVIAKFYDS